mmetsp:Transcript_638/g.872  ORF Transcript_638/g.872 Transcript_638/m.872 type:complete len:335 (+) Transcript_638:96-1100(+)
MVVTCVSSPVPKWANPPASHGRVARYSYPPPGARMIRGNPAVASRHYTPVLQKRASYIARMQQHPSSQAFMDAKSPVTRCIETIIGAADAVNRRDAWLEAQFGDASKKQAKVTTTAKKPLIPPKRAPPKKEVKQIKDEPQNNHDESDDVISREELEKVLQDKELNRNLVLMMALERPRKDNAAVAPPPNLIGEGFFWKEYPILENILFGRMAEYYQFSSNSRQSKNQQAYNNSLVEKVRSAATIHGYTFDPTFFTDKRLRDRVRCFFKTHLQNAKKRLCTMQKHLHNREQRRVLHRLIVKARQSISTLVGTFNTDDEENRALESLVNRRRETIY